MMNVFILALLLNGCVAVDLSHGEADNCIEDLASYYGGCWITIGAKREYNGTVDMPLDEALSRSVLFIIGQPTDPFSPKEIEEIGKWVENGGILWVAGDSDYGSGKNVQFIVNSVMDGIGSNLRLDYASVEDPRNNAGRGYRVICFSRRGSRYLCHGPGPVAYLLDGKMHKLSGDQDNLEKEYPLKILIFAENGKIVENTEPLAEAYSALYDENVKIPIAVAEPLGKGVVILSGETPYGGYAPMCLDEYHGVKLAGKTILEEILTEVRDLEKSVPKVVKRKDGGRIVRTAEKCPGYDLGKSILVSLSIIALSTLIAIIIRRKIR